MMKKISLAIIMTAMILFAGCSSDEPQIREIKVQDKELEGDKFKYDILVKVAIDKELEAPTSFVTKVTSILPEDEGWNTEKEGAFFPGEQNTNVKFNLHYTEYENQELQFKVELIQGTETLDTEIVKFKYEE